MGKNIVTVDGNGACAGVAYEFTEVAAIYPITPSSPMAAKTDEWSAKGRQNMFGQTVRLVEMQSEAGAIGAVHGALQTGSLAATYTSSQGLMLMIPTLYRITGEHLPAVLHVAARTVGTHAMSIFGDQSDVMACRQIGMAMLCSGSVQEAADMAAVAHLSAIKGRIPVMHFFDGFRTSHEMSRIEMPDVKKLSALTDMKALDDFREHALNPEHPLLRNTVQNDDVYFQFREANNKCYRELSDIIEDYMKKVSETVGRNYVPYQYYGPDNATDIIIAMGSVSGTIEETVDALNKRGRKTGFLQIHMYRPFDTKKFIEAIPASVNRIAVLDRCKEMGAAGEPLYVDVCTALYGAGRDIKVIGGRYGLSSKDTNPAQIVAVFDNLASSRPINSFTIGIEDDVTHLSLKAEPLDFEVGSPDMICCKFWGLGGDGTVGANHNTAKILGDLADMYSQAYFEYDAKKSFGVTKSNLRFSKKPIRGSYYVKSGDIVACHNQSFIKQYDVASEVKKGGIFLLNCTWTDEELETELPNRVKRLFAKNKVRLFVINATAIAEELGLGSHTNTVLQAAFFKISGLLPIDTAISEMKAAAEKAYFTKGSKIVKMNTDAIEKGAESVHEVAVPPQWANLSDEEIKGTENAPAVVVEVCDHINRQKGNELPVSAFIDRMDGSIEMGLTAYEKRGIAVNTPKWDPEKCLQCNMCSFVCPHAAIRPHLLSDEEAANAPETMKLTDARPAGSYKYTLSVSEFDCTGCGSCTAACPAKEKAITMGPVELTDEKRVEWDYSLKITKKSDAYNKYTLKGSQFETPLLEFSAACAGCGETPYAKIMTQLFGDRVYWANGTGCSQAWGATYPGIPYTVNERGFGPAWTNSLFENNAELMLGMYLSVNQQRKSLKKKVEELLGASSDQKIKEACQKMLDEFDDFDGSRAAADDLIEILESADDKDNSTLIQAVLARRDTLARKSFWMYGGDGWAYDIGFGGLDHVIATGANINTLVIDTEVYSNTGGQSSKATPIGAVAQFASAGKKTRKKDLGAIFMTYGNVYVASVSMGADPNQLLKVLKEAEEYDGPSVIVAYTPCITHGIKAGMGSAQAEMKRAVESGYWTLYHYDPRLPDPLVVDCKEPSLDYEEFLAGETRYSSLKKTFPENAEKLFAQGAKDAKERYEKYKAMEKNGI
ncbi:MAG: pyruvate:ferredoxin (flavodoxin) oxidoreductase [Lachnospiraceae bacterium]|nr:pyruvate:ferredoxin (flavodoxin) oxidoreductase [Lachnospiraceae bacterium]